MLAKCALPLIESSFKYNIYLLNNKMNAMNVIISKNNLEDKKIFCLLSLTGQEEEEGAKQKNI